MIIGYRTGKVLYVGIRNKYCSYCAYYESLEKEVPPHLCYRNFDRHVPSSKMESDCIAEGFKCSIEMHRLIYKNLVADNDSSVYSAVINTKPYAKEKVVVKKIQCTNHLYRNLCKKLVAISQTKQPKV